MGDTDLGASAAMLRAVPTQPAVAVRSALAILERASDSWHNGDPRAEGPLHWPVAVHFARAELQRALEALSDPSVERLQDRVRQLESIARLNADTIRGMQRAQAPTRAHDFTNVR